MQSIPKTAGKIITEAELKAYTQCPRLYRLGGKIRVSMGLKVVRDTAEVIYLKYLKEISKDPLKDMHTAMLRSLIKYNVDEHLLDAQLNKLSSSCMLWLKELFDIFPMNVYLPILGPVEPLFKINRTPIKLHISGLFRTVKNQTVHAVSFSEYDDELSISNDPTIPLKVELLKPYVAKHMRSGRSRVNLHLFAFRKDGSLRYQKHTSTNSNKENLTMVQLLVSGMEQGIHYPIVPCPFFRCERRKSCPILSDRSSS